MVKGIFGPQAVGQQELIKRTLWYIKLRWFFLLVLAGGGVLGEYFAFGLSGLVIRDIFVTFGALFINLILYVLAHQRKKSRRHYQTLALLQIVLDVVLASYLILTHGGFQSRLVILYVIPIMVSGAIFGRLAIYLATALSIASYNAVLLYDYARRSGLDAADVETAVATENFYVVMLFYSLVLIILAATASFLSKHIRHYEEEIAKEEVIALTSHQLRTPATAVKNIISALLDNYVGKLSPEQRSLLRRAYDENERELHLVETMLDVAQVDSQTMELNLEHSDVKGLVSRVADVHQPSLKSRSQKIAIKNRKKDLKWHVDKHKIYMVLDNLISNASKYSPPESTITVTLGTRSRGTWLRISVKDEGLGIDKADLERIFAKHVRLDNPATMTVTGSGLGLYLTKQVVDLHRGIISVNSEPQKGTEFIVEIPKLKPAE